ncbi:lysozyme inhibitor LprI family protein [Xylophilus sp. GOD-11R]|uniref:lysozyme inhibitor LprI family protein n=1 Tax=Xylophilus sp. GOD-11R TaxID=3089814 RepID=UPI00298C9CC9|nr:lysozyme inhibitor LprI family protein [Xylophilus sp. GOD-11R]WPB59230.1 lysozyme inhibitor LprI family protein [Xylophilus sp. GOD-11R]
MNSTTRCIAVLLGLLADSGVPAATDCTNATSQSDMNACAAQAYTQADASLNQTYRQLLQKLPTERQANLRKVQKAWLTYRDLDCGFAAAGYDGGSIQPMVKSGCLADRTDARTKQLRNLLDEASR